MTALNVAPFPLFFTIDEFHAMPLGHAPAQTTTFGGMSVVPITALVATSDPSEIPPCVALTPNPRIEVVHTATGTIQWACSHAQHQVIVALAVDSDVSFDDAAAYIAQQLFSSVTVLDSRQSPVATLAALSRVSTRLPGAHELRPGVGLLDSVRAGADDGQPIDR